MINSTGFHLSTVSRDPLERILELSCNTLCKKVLLSVCVRGGGRFLTITCPQEVFKSATWGPAGVWHMGACGLQRARNHNSASTSTVLQTADSFLTLKLLLKRPFQDVCPVKIQYNSYTYIVSFCYLEYQAKGPPTVTSQTERSILATSLIIFHSRYTVGVSTTDYDCSGSSTKVRSQQIHLHIESLPAARFIAHRLKSVPNHQIPMCQTSLKVISLILMHTYTCWESNQCHAS